MAYITVVLSLALVCWLVLAARGGDTTRADDAAAALALPVPDTTTVSVHADRGIRPVEKLSDHRRARHYAGDQQAA